MLHDRAEGNERAMMEMAAAQVDASILKNRRGFHMDLSTRGMSCAAQLTFPGSALMLFVLAFNPIFVLAAIVRQTFGDFVKSTCCAALFVSIRVELHELSDCKLMHCDHRFRFAGRRGLPAAGSAPERLTALGAGG